MNLDLGAARIFAALALADFCEQIRRDRDRIENEDEPPVDVILDLAARCIDQLLPEPEPPSFAPFGPS